MEKTKTLLIDYCKAYPSLTLQDIFKFIYQSAYGCEHLVMSPLAAAEYIEKEYKNMPCGMAEIEELDGGYARVPLSYMQNGLSPKTFASIFALSAKGEADGKEKLHQKIDVLRSLVRDGAIPFSESELDAALSKWEKDGYAAVHHSDAFREAYKPSYRVISKDFIPFLPLFAKIDTLAKKGRALVAIDGGSASGKTTLSAALEKVYDCTMFHMDDFFLQMHQRTPERFATVGGNIDHERFLKEVLLPVSRGERVEYRKFDCSTMSLGESVFEDLKNIVFVEGAYSLHPALEKFYDFKAFLDISPKLQRERIEKRNPPMLAKRFFEEWIPFETTFFEKTDIKNRADLVIEIK